MDSSLAHVGKQLEAEHAYLIRCYKLGLLQPLAPRWRGLRVTKRLKVTLEEKAPIAITMKPIIEWNDGLKAEVVWQSRLFRSYLVPTTPSCPCSLGSQDLTDQTT